MSELHDRTSAPALRIENLSKSFMGVAALADVGFDLHAGAVLGLIGPNGSGKSTVLDCITGFVRPDAGSIMLNDKPLSGMAAHLIARRGVARTFQTVKLYDELSLDDHVVLSVRGLSMTRTRRAAEDARDLNPDWLLSFGLDRLRSAPAGILSYGQKKLLALAMVLAARPRIAMLDEPLAGVNPRIVDVIHEAVQSANALGQTFLIVEHNVEFVSSICSEVVVLDAGRKLAEGPPSIIWDNPAVYEAFLGSKGGNNVV